MSGRKMLNIPVDTDAHPETVERWEQLRQAVAAELDVDPDSLARWEILRESAEAYCGNQSLGEWREQQ